VSPDGAGAQAPPTEAGHSVSDGGYTVTVTPERFTMVDYEADTIARTVVRLCQQVGLPDGMDVRVEVDQTTPLGRAHIASADPVVLVVESGALEDNHRPRQFHETNAALVFGRLLLKLRDRLDPGFSEAPSDDELTLELATAWDVYATGRLNRMGYDAQRQRRLYQFRVRHGFSDDTDAVFAQLWLGEGLAWADISQLSSQALVQAT
jgi:hypothetical protein